MYFSRPRKLLRTRKHWLCKKGGVLQRSLLIFYIQQEGCIAEKQIEYLGDSIIYSGDIFAQIPAYPHIITLEFWNIPQQILPPD